MDSRGWRLRSCPSDWPLQENTWDCGVYVCMFAEFLTLDFPIMFTQREIGACRELIAIAILESRDRNQGNSPETIEIE